MTDFRIPVATYRIQFNLGFRFTDACDLVPYLHELGITDLYASPRFKARKGSSHGYDVADPQRINSELGTEKEFEELVQRLKHYGMGLLLDIVPNHMAASPENPWWMDVLENGPSSPYAHYFDVDWHPLTTRAAFLQENKVLFPVLGDLYWRVLENQEIALRLEENGFFFRYHDWKLPLDPKTYGPIVEHCLEGLRESLGAEHPDVQEASSMLDVIDRLPARTTSDPQRREERRAENQEIKERLWRLYQGKADFRARLEETLRAFNGTQGVPESLDRLDQLLADQAYRLAFWKKAADEINYRRFFDVSDLVGLRVEDPEVFEAWHAPVLRLVQEGKVTGLRIDHIDGLYDPLSYLQRLQSSIAPAKVGQRESKNLFVVVEKILGANESLPAGWPVEGTTGYDFLNAVNGVLIDPLGYKALEEVYARFTGSQRSFAEIRYACCRQVMEQLLAGEVNALGDHLEKLATQDRHARDLPLFERTEALVEVTASLPVYRTYIRSLDVSQRDRAYLERALEVARGRTRTDVGDAAFEFLRRAYLLDTPNLPENQKDEWLRFVMRWQQLTGPVMAKGLEDTAFYVHNSLISLNEVGADPLRKDPLVDAEAFHLLNQERLTNWPATLNATSTHDTKRSEDVRARIDVLSELPEEWETRLKRWSRWNQGQKRTVKAHLVPTPGEEVFLYQTMLGAWPLEGDELPGFKERLVACLIKSSREAKVHTSWISPDSEHEVALRSFVESILDTSEKNRFLTDFLGFQKQIAFYGAVNGLAQALLKIASPGVPDFYQGTELWDLHLVDPDNRRPVDFQKRVHLLEEIKAREVEGRLALVKDLLDNWRDGRIKLFMTCKALNFRREHKELFFAGEYIPLYGAGKLKGNLCAFARQRDTAWVIVAVPRLATWLLDPSPPPSSPTIWGAGNLVLPREAPDSWRSVFTGEDLKTSSAGRHKALRLQDVFHSFPVALLAGEKE